MERQKGWYKIILIAILVISLIFLFFENVNAITGNVVEGSTTSNVTIEKYLAIAFSTSLSQGIYFGSVDTLPATDINATHDYDGASSATTYYISVSGDGNSQVDFCLKANAPLTNNATEEIPLVGETYSNSSSSNSTVPVLGDQVSMTTSYVKSGNAIAAGSDNFYRFWLDVPAIQPSGEYNNTVSFKGVVTGLACTV